MRMVMLRVFALFVWASLFAGCTGIQVVDNMYGPVGRQHIQVSQDMEYLGNPNVYAPSICTRNCPLIATNSVKTRSDLFAKQKDGKLSELCVIERRMLSGRNAWNPMYGNKVYFGDKEYLESYWRVSDLEGDYVNAYMNYLVSLGYDLDIPDVVGRVLVRNMTNTTKVFLFYGCNIDFLPEEIRGDFAKETEFIKKRFEERFVVADG